MEHVKFHNSVKSPSLCLFDFKNTTPPLAVGKMKNPECEVRSCWSRSWWNMDGCHRGTFLRLQRITEKLATHTLSSWLAIAISVSLQLTVCIVCRIRSGGTSPTGPQSDLTATGTGFNPPQHVLQRQTKWLFTIIQVSHIPAREGLELRSKQHLSGRLEEFGGGPACPAKADREVGRCIARNEMKQRCLNSTLKRSLTLLTACQNSFL